MPDTEEQGPGVAPPRGLVRSALTGLGGALDRWDVLCLLGLALLTVGLWLWVGAGIALCVDGGLVLLLGVVGAVMAEMAERAAVSPPADRRG